MDKQLIAERFARARATYSREARVQQQVAEKMTALLRSILPDARFDRIAEFGCGTGLYSQLIYDTWHPSLLHLNDLCPEMRFCLDSLTAWPGVIFEAGDAETCSLPDGLDSFVAQGGTNFSGGQKQRLSIARALVKKPELYIFDDSFSALDFKTDAALRKALAAEPRDAAVLIIAQRVSSIRHAQQIVVLNEGKMAGIGTHEELMETCKVYQEIYESQTKEAQEA